MRGSDLKKLLKDVFEIIRPNLREYYRVVRKAKIIKNYVSDGNYYADVRLLKNDGSIDENEPIVEKAEISNPLGGALRGLIAPPGVGTECDLGFYDGDPNYPFISGFRWKGKGAPAAQAGEMILANNENNKDLFKSDGSREVNIEKDYLLTAIKIALNSADIKLGENPTLNVVLSNFLTLFNTHVHGGVEPGGGSTAVPTVQAAPATHASTQVKAK